MSSVRERLVCQCCVDRSGVDRFEETTLGIIGPRTCMICGRTTAPSELRQPRLETWDKIREALKE